MGLVEEGEEKDVVVAFLQGVVASFLLPQELWGLSRARCHSGGWTPRGGHAMGWGDMEGSWCSLPSSFFSSCSWGQGYWSCLPHAGAVPEAVEGRGVPYLASPVTLQESISWWYRVGAGG